MTRRDFHWVQGTGLVATVFALSLLVITAGLQWTLVPAYATERGEERRDARDTKQEGRDEARAQKKECKEADDKSRAECRHEKRETKEEARDTAKDIKRK
jgi:hypothetical protein